LKKNVVLALAATAAMFLIPVMQSSPFAQAAQAPADPNAWTIDTSHSAANFAVRHLMVSTVRGTLGPVKGTIWYDGKSVSSVRADVTIDVAGINTANDGRDTHLRSADFFDVPNHPTITFKSKRAEPGAGGAFKLIGDLTMRGTTKEVTLDVEAPAAVITQAGRNGGAPTYRTGTSATTTVNRFDYGLKWNNLMADSNAVVSADVRVTIDLELTKR
jgi:polyisoprenoid-binding protein YceI